MKLKTRLIEEIKTLSNSNILRLYDMAMTLKECEKPNLKTTSDDYISVRKALGNCKGSLSEDILEERNEKI